MQQSQSSQLLNCVRCKEADRSPSSQLDKSLDIYSCIRITISFLIILALPHPMQLRSTAAVLKHLCMECNLFGLGILCWVCQIYRSNLRNKTHNCMAHLLIQNQPPHPLPQNCRERHTCEASQQGVDYFDTQTFLINQPRTNLS